MGLAFAPHQTIRNEILASLSAEDLAELRPHLTRVRLVPGQVLIEPGQSTEHVFFIEEGMVGCLAVLATDAISGANAVSQIQGVAVRLKVVDLMNFITGRPALRELCLVYVQSLMQQTMQTAASNAQNTLVERCIRWLLMAHDRIDGDELPITHEALSVVLGVRRASVIVVVCALHDSHLIPAGRGRITVIDRAGLEQNAGGHGWQGAPFGPPGAAALSPAAPNRVAG